MKRTIALLCTSLAMAHAEEGGTGHYAPGSMASFIDAVPAAETFLVRVNLLGYEGSIDSSLPLPFAGVTTFGAESEVFGSGLTLLWRPGIDLGTQWSWAASATIPWLWVDVTANAEVTGPRGRTIAQRRLTSSEDGLGDIVLMPLMLNYKASDDFSINFRVAAYAPTGDYEVGRLANPGRNYWSFEPTMGFIYLGQKSGIEASLFAGYTLNTENRDTDYDSGDQFHLDGTLAQHFPLFGGLAGVGASGYWYQQVTDDSGSGARLGGFRGRTSGLGPVISWTRKLGGTDLIAEFKWLHELETENRMEGNFFWGKIAFRF